MDNIKEYFYKIIKRINISPKYKKILIIGSISFLLLFGLIVGADAVLNRGKIHYGVVVSGIELGLKSKSEAKRIVTKKLKDIYSQQLELEERKEKWYLKPKDIELEVNIDKSIDKAYSISREGTLLNRLKTKILSYIIPRNITFVYSIDNEKLKDFVYNICLQIDKEPIDAKVEIKGKKAWVVSGEVGRKVEKADLYALIRKYIISIEDEKINIPIRILPTNVTEEDAKSALKDVLVMISDNVGLKYDKYRWEISPSEITKLITFKFIKKENKKTGKVKKKYRAIIDRDKLDKFLKQKVAEIYIHARDAEFRIQGTKAVIVPSQNGREVDSAEAFPKLNKAVLSEPPREIILTTRIVEPELSTEEAEAMDIEELVSSYKTNFNPNNKPRVHNIHLLASKLNNVIIAPGEVFSFNQIIGPRTADKGFVEAPAIINGDLLPAIGGGVCQVATTLFNSVFFGGYDIKERHNHSLYISNYPNGRDAGVSYPSPDLKFRNDTSAHLLIKTWYSNSSITVSIYSTDFNTEVTYETTDFTNIKSYSSKKIDDPELEKGKEEVETKGVEGKDISVYRTVKRNGKIVQKDVFFSRYIPKNEIIRVGTKEPSKTETTVGEIGSLPATTSAAP